MRSDILLFILSITYSFLFAQNNAPEVTNVTFSQRTDSTFIVDVYYDLNDTDGDTMFVTMQVSEDSGFTWDFACDSIIGDVGANILSDTSKHIVWNFGAEHPQIFGNAFRISIIANDRGVESGIVTDIDRNLYKTIKIGDQWWMAENLKVTHYQNGDAIPNVTIDSTWFGLSTGAYCYYHNDTTNVAIYGNFYNWYAVVDSLNIAPAGWHAPSHYEWQTLVDYLGGGSIAGGKMKTTGTIQGGDGFWFTPNAGATNSSGFSALPGGIRGYDGIFSGMGYAAYFWSTLEYHTPTAAWARHLNYGASHVYISNYNKQDGFSVRCIRD